jgi:hypothetical protein
LEGRVIVAMGVVRVVSETPEAVVVLLEAIYQHLSRKTEFGARGKVRMQADAS